MQSRAIKVFILIPIVFALSVSFPYGQVITGGTFLIDKSVTKPAGDSTGGSFGVTTTAGQAVTGNNLHGSTYMISSGFWTFILAPTAASVTVGGRVITAHGFGIRNAILTLTMQNGTSLTTVTGSLGYYQFSGVTAGQTVTITVRAPRYTFDQSVRVLNVSDEVNDFNFVATAGGLEAARN